MSGSVEVEIETVSFEAGVRREISTASGQSFSARCAFAQPRVWLMWPFCPLLYRSCVPLPAPTCLGAHGLTCQPLVGIAALRVVEAWPDP